MAQTRVPKAQLDTTLVDTTTAQAVSGKTETYAAGTASVAPVKLTSGTNLTTATAGAVEYDGRAQYFTPSGTQRGVMPAMQEFILDAALVGANSSSAQDVFGVGVTLNANTYYEFSGEYYFSKTAGTTAHFFNLQFGGTATVNKIGYCYQAENNTIAFNAQTNTTTAMINAATATQITATISTAGVFIIVRFSGNVSIGAGGTFRPQYSPTAAPGGAYTTAANSAFRIWPVGASGANVSVGSWAP